MPVIYQTINLYNKEFGITPYLYIGSQQTYTSKYFGSSKQLRADIARLGVSCFKKEVLYSFDNNTTNTDLRLIESELQVFIKAAESKIYYNRTNTALKGYIETEDQKIARVNKMRNGWKNWKDSLTEKEQLLLKDSTSNRITKYNNSIKGKSHLERYGEEKASRLQSKYKGINNGMSKQLVEVSTGKIFESMAEALAHFKLPHYRKVRALVKQGKLNYL